MQEFLFLDQRKKRGKTTQVWGKFWFEPQNDNGTNSTCFLLFNASLLANLRWKASFDKGKLNTFYIKDKNFRYYYATKTRLKMHQTSSICDKNLTLHNGYSNSSQQSNFCSDFSPQWIRQWCFVSMRAQLHNKPLKSLNNL